MAFYLAIIDYGMGNLKSIYKLFQYLNIESKITSDPNVLRNADGIILPGVGAFGDAMKNLKNRKIDEIIKELVKENKPLLGICLGLQLLFSKSFEMGEYEGLNIMEGIIIPFEKNKVGKIPQIGWSDVYLTNPNHFLMKNIPNNAYFYFVHRYFAVPKIKEMILGKTVYGKTEFASIIQKENVVATQFHPEKSSKHGIQLYKNFIEYCKK
ncbi:MAG: imidazole glycerol phosphate synthase subunit HisH [Promethearchaeota archaeon]